MLADSNEIEAVLSFFSKHRGRQLNVSVSIFEGLTQREEMRVAKVGGVGPLCHHVKLASLDSEREIEIDLDHYSLATVSPDRREIEVTRLLGGGVSCRLTASEI